MKGLRLAIVCRRVSGLSGTVTSILEHCRRLSEQGCSIDIYGENLDRKAIVAAGAAPRLIAGWPWGSYFKRRLFAFWADLRVRAGYDLVWGHGDHFRQDILSLHNCVHAAHEAVYGRPLPASSGVGRLHERQLRGGNFRRIIANSQLMRADLIKRFEIPESLITVIHPGHDPARFNMAGRASCRAAMRQKLGFSAFDVVFGLITSGDFTKRGVEVFLQALSVVARQSSSSLKALVMGKENHLGPYRDKAQALGLEGIVSFLPASPEIEKFYHALDVYVHCAHYEEFGQSVQEAMACGLPVLTNRNVGACELFKGELEEFLLKMSEPEALAKQMGALYLDPSLRRRLGEEGARLVAANTWPANFSATQRICEEVLKRTRKT